MVGSGLLPLRKREPSGVLAAGVPVPASTDCSPEADASTDCSADAGADSGAASGADSGADSAPEADSATDCASEHWTELDLLFDTSTLAEVWAMTPRTPPPLSSKGVVTETTTSSVPEPFLPARSTDAKFDSTSAM